MTCAFDIPVYLNMFVPHNLNYINHNENSVYFWIFSIWKNWNEEKISLISIRCFSLSLFSFLFYFSYQFFIYDFNFSFLALVYNLMEIFKYNINVIIVMWKCYNIALIYPQRICEILRFLCWSGFSMRVFYNKNGLIQSRFIEWVSIC